MAKEKSDKKIKTAMNKSIFYERLMLLVRESGKSVNQIERELGYPRNALHNYKNGRDPSGVRLVELANYFKASPEYLIGKSELLIQEDLDYIFKKLSKTEKVEMLKLCQNWVENIIKTGLHL